MSQPERKTVIMKSLILLALLMGTPAFANSFSEVVSDECDFEATVAATAAGTKQAFRFWESKTAVEVAFETTIASRKACIVTAKGNAHVYKDILHQIDLGIGTQLAMSPSQQAFTFSWLKVLKSRMQNQFAGSERLEQYFAPQLTQALADAHAAIKNGDGKALRDSLITTNQELETFKKELK
jgi:hypothetical protein